MYLSDDSYEFVSQLDDSDESDESAKENAIEALEEAEAERIVKDLIEKYTTLQSRYKELAVNDFPLCAARTSY